MIRTKSRTQPVVGAGWHKVWNCRASFELLCNMTPECTRTTHRPPHKHRATRTSFPNVICIQQLPSLHTKPTHDTCVCVCEFVQTCICQGLLYLGKGSEIINGAAICGCASQSSYVQESWRWTWLKKLFFSRRTMHGCKKVQMESQINKPLTLAWTKKCAKSLSVGRTTSIFAF